MKRVETHLYRTPTANNRDCEWSIGVMNMTRAEAELVERFARGIRSINSDRARGVTATEMRGLGGDGRMGGPAVTYEQTRAEALKRAYEAEMAMSPDDRRRYLIGNFIPGEPSDEPELDEPRNRFSGLDIE